MITSESASSKVTTSHRAKLAYLYLRQSSLSQVAHHAESTEMQYRLMDRAIALGWPREPIRIVDEDLGKSEKSADNRLGFQQIIAELGLGRGRVGLVLSLDASRLARNCSDWHRLIELCALFGALIADGEQLYDPRQYHDRLPLGFIWNDERGRTPPAQDPPPGRRTAKGRARGTAYGPARRTGASNLTAQ